MSKKTVALIKYLNFPAKRLIIAAVFAALSAVAALFIPLISGAAVDIISKEFVNYNSLNNLLVILSCVIVFAALTSFAVSYIANKITAKTVFGLRQSVFSKYLRLRVDELDKKSIGDLVTRATSDITVINDGVTSFLVSFLTGIITIIGTLVLMLMINPIIALSVAVLTPLSFFVATTIANGIDKYFKESAKKTGELSGFANEYIGGSFVVKIAEKEEVAKKGFQKINKELLDASTKAQFYSSLTNPTTRVVNYLIYIATGLLGVYFAIDGSLSVGDISALLIYANQYTKPFNEISGVFNVLQSAISAGERTGDVFSYKEEHSGSVKIDITGAIKVSNLSFSYDGVKDVLKDISFEIKPSEKIAIVGPTGCGKTTLINLLMGYFEDYKGEILFSETPLRELDRDSLLSEVSSVLQEPVIFKGSIRDNISYGNSDATDDEIKSAANRSFAQTFIEKSEDGYNMQLSENGEELSVGQRQLISIARVMLRDPKILILDEATSSIDTLTEQLVIQAFRRLLDGRTSIVIAHRLSTIIDADKILVLRDGELIEVGNHKELIENGGFYSKMYSEGQS